MAMSDCCGSQSCIPSQQQHCALVLPWGCQPPKAILRACLRLACAYVHFVLGKKARVRSSWLLSLILLWYPNAAGLYCSPTHTCLPSMYSFSTPKVSNFPGNSTQRGLQKDRQWNSVSFSSPTTLFKTFWHF